MVIAFNPWLMVISVVITVVLAAMECSPEEAQTALSEGAHLCHSVGTWCSRCIRSPFGGCISCITHTTGKCCFNSVLARVVNEQGRAQVGKAWGDSQHPDCSGFSVAQLQSLDFAAMDLSEFYASLVAKQPNLGSIQTHNSARVPACYYGQGKC